MYLIAYTEFFIKVLTIDTNLKLFRSIIKNLNTHKSKFCVILSNTDYIIYFERF